MQQFRALDYTITNVGIQWPTLYQLNYNKHTLYLYDLYILYTS